MAITFFSRTVGMVAAFRDPTLPSRYLIRLPGWEGFYGFKAIVTNIQVASRGNYQFLHTLGGNIFVYVFGDRVGQLTVSGLAFDAICDRSDRVHGIEYVFAYYNKNRIANRKLPLKVTIGSSTTITAYLTGIAAGVEDVKTRIWSYQFQLAMIPEPNKRSLASGSSTAPAPSDDRTTEPPAPGDDYGGQGNVGPPGKYDDVGEIVGYPWPDRTTTAASEHWNADKGGWSTDPEFNIPVEPGDGYVEVGTGPNTNMTAATVS